MHITLDPTSGTPLYQQIHDRIVEAIACGDLKKGDKLLSVRALSRAAAVNPSTAVKAYDLLRAEGLVVANRRSGMIVAHDASVSDATAEYAAEWGDRLAILIGEARSRGLSDDDILATCSRTVAHFQRAHQKNTHHSPTD